MATATRAELRELIARLADEELDAARDALQRLSLVREAQEVSECDRRLLEEGLIARIPDPNPARRDRRFEPIRVDGKPVSETIIEDRR